MTESEIREYIASHRERQPGIKILWGHPSPRFWTPRSLSLREIAALRRPERKLVVYLHIPFCPKTDPPACGFCLFAREDYSGNTAVEKYLDFLRREIEMYADVFRDDPVDCVYFGGGTPNVLRPADYARVMGWVRGAFRLTREAEVTLEGVPQLFDRERLEAMAKAGVTRISIGAQVLDPRLLRFSGRQHTAEHVFDAVDGAHRLGMSANVDLICGWFEQTPQDVESDVRALLPHAPESVIVHLLTLTGPSPFAQESSALPSVPVVREGFERARRALVSNGYWNSSYIDFMLKDPPRGPAEVKYLRAYRESLAYDRIGLGCAASSLFAGTPDRPGMTWRNVTSTSGYYAGMDGRRPPVAEAFAFNALDLRLLYVLKGLEGTPSLDAFDYRRLFSRDLAEDFAGYWSVLQELRWLTVEDRRHYRLQGEGIFHTALIQRCLSNDRNDELRGASRA
ncbi:MAG TPA: radical SAM protein [Elusimicrobiota bacterium]|nr:radical SAM protein [Elusimicrobiota bacterium]